MRVCVTGHRPDKIGGYNPDNPLRLALREVLRAKLLEFRPELAYTGMALGIDQDFASICIELEVPFVAAIPFLGQESRWPPQARETYASLLARAFHIHYVCKPGYAAWKMQRRNEWMVDQVGVTGIVLAVWNGSEGGTGNCVQYASKVGRKLVPIDPLEIERSLAPSSKGRTPAFHVGNREFNSPWSYDDDIDPG